MRTFEFRLTDDLTVPVRANTREEAERIMKYEIAKREASPLFDKVYFDYETGINVPSLRAALGRQEKDTEKENVLRNFVGSSGFTRSTKNDFAITPEGQRTLADKGLLDRDKISDKNIVIDENKAFTAGDFADFSGAVGPIFGAITALNPYFRVARGLQVLFRSPAVSNAVAAGLGSAGGKAAEEGLDIAQGYQDKTASELADLLKFEFGVGTVAQGVGELGIKTFGAFFGRKAPTIDVRDTYVVNQGLSMDDVYRLDERLGRIATERDIKKAVKAGEVKEVGVRAALSQRALGASLRARFQAAGETIFGKTKRERKIIEYNLASLAQLQNKIADKRAALKSYSDFADSDSRVISELRAKRAELDKAESAIQNEITRLITDLSEQSAGFNSSVMNAAIPGKKELGKNIQKTISEAYKQMMKNHESSYNSIFNRLDKLNPEYTVDLSDIEKTLNQIFGRGRGIGESNIPSEIKKLLKAIEKKPEFTPKELVEARKIINGVKETKDLTGDAGDAVEQTYKALDEKINNLPKNLSTIKGDDAAKTKVANIIKDLQKQNADYYNSLLPFDRLKATKIMSDRAKDPDDVYNAIFGLREVGDAKALLQSIPAESRAALQQGLLRRFLKEQIKTSIDDPITGAVNPVKFANKILKKKDVLETFLGPRAGQFFQTIEDFAKLRPNLSRDELLSVADELSGRIPQMEVMAEKGIINYPPAFNRFVEALKEKAETSAASLDLKKSGLLGRIDAASPEEIAKIVFRPKSSADINRIKNLVSEEAFADIQDQAFEQIIKDSVQTGSTKLSDIFKPGNLERALRSYDDETLTAMFGPELTKSLKNYARTLRITVGEETAGGAGSLVAGALALNVFNVALWPTVAAMGLYKAIFSNPRIAGLLAKTDPSAVAEVLKFVGNTIKFGGIRELGGAVTEGTEALEEEIRKLDQSEEGEVVKGVIDNLKGTFQTESKRALTPQLSASLDIPPVVINPTQTARPLSESLLGGSSANEDIARSLNRIA